MIPDVWGLLALPGLIFWGVILLFPWRPWSTRESLDSGVTNPAAHDLSAITVLIPARNEADVIVRTLESLAAQGGDPKIILIDDQSTDQTVAKVRRLNFPRLEIIHGLPPPPGWSGKLWALEQGRKEINTELVLLLDADIRLLPGILPSLLQKLDRDQLELVSLMAYLNMEGFWEKLLIPAYVFFFKLLYPFHLSNSPASSFAAAAGGCILVKKELLNRIGAFSSLKSSLIDDCALARKAKDHGGRTWIGLTRSVVSLRQYHELGDIWDMVARSAYTQLRYAPALLALCTLLMTVLFLFPLIAVLLLEPAGFSALLLMLMCYRPTLRYYDIHPCWGCLLPVTGILYLLMTWSSAWRHQCRKGAVWKGRSYAMRRERDCTFR